MGGDLTLCQNWCSYNIKMYMLGKLIKHLFLIVRIISVNISVKSQNKCLYSNYNLFIIQMILLIETEYSKCVIHSIHFYIFLVQQNATCVHGGVKIHLVQLPTHPFYFSQVTRRKSDTKKKQGLRKFGRRLPNKMLMFYNFIRWRELIKYLNKTIHLALLFHCSPSFK